MRSPLMDLMGTALWVVNRRRLKAGYQSLNDRRKCPTYTLMVA